MGIAGYETAVRQTLAESIDEGVRRRLEGLAESPLGALSRRMLSLGKVGYQEAIIDRLMEDLVGERRAGQGNCDGFGHIPD